MQRKHLRTGNGKHTDVTSPASPSASDKRLRVEFLFFRNSGQWTVDVDIDISSRIGSLNIDLRCIVNIQGQQDRPI